MAEFADKTDIVQWCLDSPDAVSATKSSHDVVCSPLGIPSLMTNTASSVLQMWPQHTLYSDISTESGPSSDADVYSILDLDDGRRELRP